MKKILFSLAAVAMLFATSCKKENINVPERPAEDNEFLCVIEPNANPQNAPRINDGMGTMAHLVDNRATWQEGDVIAYYGAAYDDNHQPIDGYRHDLTCATFGNEQTGSAYFEKANTHFGQGDHKAFYPAELLVSADESHYELALPAVQTIDPERNASNLPMYGVGSGRHYITFYNICGVLNIVVPVASDKIVLTADQALCGPIYIGGEDDKTAVADGTEDQHKTLTLVAKANTTFAEGGFVYAAIPAGEYSGLTIKFYRGDYLVAEKTTTNALTVARNTIKNINTNIPREGLYFTAVGGDIYLSLTKTGSGNDPELSYSIYDYVNNKYVQNCDWTNYTVGTELHLTANQRVFFIKRTDVVGAFSSSASNRFEFKIDSKKGTGTAAVGGNVMYLIDKTGQASVVPSWCFYRLFVNCAAKLTNVDDLRLPATEVKSNGYNGMFQSNGFAKAPELPATTLESNCYCNMFKGCQSLTTAPNLPATILAESCYSNMFEGCVRLTTAPNLPATTLAKSCYSNMFKSCSYLTTAPALPATTLFESCYQSMFEGCTALVNAPALPATTLAISCYQFMFQSCSGNLVAPELPAEELVTNCYYMMFNACGWSAQTNFTSVKMKATRIASGASGCLQGWLYQAGQYTTNKILTVSNSVTADPNSDIWNMINAQTPINGATAGTSKGWTIKNVDGDLLRNADGSYPEGSN